MRPPFLFEAPPCIMQTKVMKKRLLVLLMVPFAFGATSCNADKPVPPGPTVSGTPGVAISRSKAQYQQGLERAHATWEKNATLSRVYQLYNGAISPEPPPPLVYSFTSLADPGRAFEVAFTGDTVVDRKVPLTSFELNLTPIDPNAWEVDPDKALELAEDAGGRTFREKHLVGFKVLQQLQLRGTYSLMWYFRYDTGDGSGLRYEIYVNAKSGAIEFQREIPAPAPEAGVR